MEGVWKRDIRLACKALDLKGDDGSENLDVQLGKLDVKSVRQANNRRPYRGEAEVRLVGRAARWDKRKVRFQEYRR